MIIGTVVRKKATVRPFYCCFTIYVGTVELRLTVTVGTGALTVNRIDG